MTGLQSAEDPSVRAAVEADLAMIVAFNDLIKPLEWQIEKIACQHDHNSLYLLRTIPGVGRILALVILYEVQDIKIKASLLASTPTSWAGLFILCSKIKEPLI